MLAKKKVTEEAEIGSGGDYSLRKAREKAKRRKRERRAEEEGARVLVPLVLTVPAPAKHCDVCGLRCDRIGALAALPLGKPKTKEEREAKERRRKEKGKPKKEKKGIHKDNDSRKAEKMAKKERKLLKKLAHDKQKEAERTLQAQQEAAKNEMAALHALGAEERRALNLQIDRIYHQLHCSLEQLDCVARACEARRVLTKFYGEYLRVLVDALSRQLLGATQYIRLELRHLDAEESEALEADLATFTLDLVSTVPEPPSTGFGDERNVPLELDALTTYLMQAVERQRHLYLRHDAIWVAQHAQDVVFGAPDFVPRATLAYVAAIQREYAFVYLASLQDFYAGLRRAHDGKTVRVTPKTRGDAPREPHEEVLQRSSGEEESEEDEGSLSADTEESITDEEELLRQAAKSAPRNQGLARDAKGHMTLEGKQRYIVCPILRDPYGLGQFFALDMTTYLIALVRLVRLNDNILAHNQALLLTGKRTEQITDIMNPLALSQYNAMLNCFLFTTHTNGQAYYLEYLVDATYRYMQNAVQVKRKVTDKQHKVRGGAADDDDDGDDDEEEEDEETPESKGSPEESSSGDDDDSSSDGGDGGNMLVERKPKKQEIVLFRKPDSSKRSARLAEDEFFVKIFVQYLYDLLVTGREDRDPDRVGWDPQVKTRAHKKPDDSMGLRVIFEEEARENLRKYDEYLAELAQSHLKETTPQECIEMVDEVTTEVRLLKEQGKEPFYVARATGERRLVLPAKEKILKRQDFLFTKAMIYLSLTRSLAHLLAQTRVLRDYVLERQYPYLGTLDEQGLEVECNDDDDSSEESSDQLSDVEPRSADEDYTPVRRAPRNNNNNNNNNQATVESDDES